MKKTPFIQKQLSYISQVTNVIFKLGITYFVYVIVFYVLGLMEIRSILHPGLGQTLSYCY